MGEMYFDPAEITVPAGEVTFVVTNDGAVVHDFVIEELGVNIVLNPGETGEATVTVEPGTYEIICTLPGHAVAGMVGTLIVE